MVLGLNRSSKSDNISQFYFYKVQQDSVFTESAMVLFSTSLGLPPIPKQGSSLAIASRNLGWDTAYTTGFRQEAVLAAGYNQFIFAKQKIEEQKSSDIIVKFV